MEQVFVVRRDDFFDGAWPHGFMPLEPGAGQEMVEAFEQRGFFADRAEAERTPAWKQLIPYCLVSRPGELFCVQRLNKGSEDRLHGLYSVGLGGHINPVDRSMDAERDGLVREALERELSEELRIADPTGATPRFLGLLNDDQTEVGRVHVGVVFILELPSATKIRIREVSVLRGRFAPIAELPHGSRAAEPRVVEATNLWHDASGFETWSAILLEACPWWCPGASEGSKHVAANREESHNG